MKLRLFLYYCFFFLFISCNSDNPPGNLKEIGIEKNKVQLQGKEKQSAIIKTKEQGWAIGGIFIPDEKDGELKYNNKTYLKEYEDGSKIIQLCDTMNYEWIELIKLSPNELKITVDVNPSSTQRTIRIWLEGLVGYLGEEILIIQQGNDKS